MNKDITPAVLIILDGFGLPDADPTLINAIQRASTPTFDRLFNEYPHSKIQTSGEYVGLPDGQMGNSEIGHLSLGAGRVSYTEIVRIQKSLDDHSFAHKVEFKECMQKLQPPKSLMKGFFYMLGADISDAVKQKKKQKLHLMGLLSDGGVHSHIDHLKGILNLCKNEYPNTEVCIHAFLDGRDTAPNSGLQFLEDIMAYTKKIQYGRLASVVGRYYAMDRDNRWDRVEKAYNVLTLGLGEKVDEHSVLDVVRSFYSKKITDEFMEPISVGNDGTIQDGDAVLFFNFRADRARELTQSLTDLSFTSFHRQKKVNVNFLCLTEYKKEFNLPVLFPPSELKNILGEVISNQKLKQLRLAETEKYAHVTFFFNGGNETPFENEDRILIPSPNVATYDLQPEMSAYLIKDALLKAMDEDYSLIVVNFANGDMVGHTGIVDAAIKAVEVLDSCIKEIVAKTLEKNYTLLITADHGNCEQMLAEDRSTPFTQHTTQPVPLILVGNSFHQKHSILKDGMLADIAPTVLALMNIDIPRGNNGMTGTVLVHDSY